MIECCERGGLTLAQWEALPKEERELRRGKLRAEIMPDDPADSMERRAEAHLEAAKRAHRRHAPRAGGRHAR